MPECPLKMFSGVTRNSESLWSSEAEMGYTDYSSWMAQPNVGVYNRPITKVYEIYRSDTLLIYFSVRFQIQISKWFPNVGEVYLCRPSSGSGGRNNQNFSGGGSPPPPDNREKDCMCGCDCNDIATMIQRQLAEQSRLFESLKDHIDRRVKEEVIIHGKQLEGMTVDLQPMMDRINQVESNLWNGIKE